MKVLKQSLGILDWQNFLTDKNHMLLLLFGAQLVILLLSISQLGSLQKKTDVYGFGILLLELITGPKTLSNGRIVSKGDDSKLGNFLCICTLFLTVFNSLEKSNTHIPLQVTELKEEKKLDKLVVRDLKDSFDVAELESSVDVIIQCTQSNPILRPKMSEVLHALEAHVMITESSIDLNKEPLPYAGTYGFSVRHEDPHDSSSFIIEPIEL
jgi:serine/threonine protein kinase